LPLFGGRLDERLAVPEGESKGIVRRQLARQPFGVGALVAGAIQRVAGEGVEERV